MQVKKQQKMDVLNSALDAQTSKLKEEYDRQSQLQAERKVLGQQLQGLAPEKAHEVINTVMGKRHEKEINAMANANMLERVTKTNVAIDKLHEQQRRDRDKEFEKADEQVAVLDRQLNSAPQDQRELAVSKLRVGFDARAQVVAAGAAEQAEQTREVVTSELDVNSLQKRVVLREQQIEEVANTIHEFAPTEAASLLKEQPVQPEELNELVMSLQNERAAKNSSLLQEQVTTISNAKAKVQAEVLEFVNSSDKEDDDPAVIALRREKKWELADLKRDGEKKMAAAMISLNNDHAEKLRVKLEESGDKRAGARGTAFTAGALENLAKGDTKKTLGKSWLTRSKSKRFGGTDTGTLRGGEGGASRAEIQNVARAVADIGTKLDKIDDLVDKLANIEELLKNVPK